ncbi:kinesin-like protein KIN-12F isoform X2 [Asparagus officinalis]|uniref:kinesin-like protein KIN-12F isoform X2 n=1 Tax=Asparagus officinalis TaxID=4686 RepID=UPI00098DF0BC|nr:kinesin-like protein KIN-12F isoform X2 [Asparagus officinalis]
MLRDVKFSRRHSGKIPQSEESNENLPFDSSSTPHIDSDPNRPPFNAIQEVVRNPKLGGDQETSLRRKIERTPSKNQSRGVSDAQFRTPEKQAATKIRFGFVPKSEPGSSCGDNEVPANLPPLSRGLSLGSGGGYNYGTPRTYRTAGKASSVHSDCSSVQSTPTKSVSKPTHSGFGSSRPPMSAGRTMNCAVASKGIPMSAPAPLVYVAAEVPHFELREDPSFWMDHNVQVVIRVRPINSSEQSLQGYSRCLKQENAHSITWIGQPESRFTFDYVACETISQEMLFRVAGLPMVENCMSGYNSCMFAYGQTGSGKTYTMLGEIGEVDLRPSADRGMTPRIFEFLFARIKAEEESRRDEKLKYHCKCSFLEIYNEHITDLLHPSSTNLPLREDIRKGVYVENLTEFEVETVNDILRLLFQGAANRKVAATNMNRESSRSHSVFTCVIESRWEKDSTTNLRFARLNLVDLAGSERQKTSGVEGERLKEAVSINKSLSALGHVITVLADVAHGKQRHVPYRDSRLTFLLQDSLGGNSKTMIIANVSPSICSANETLGTLKFAQRARLVQNNAVINEDASGDISALQHQIRLLKEELSLLKRQNVSRSLLFRSEIMGDNKDGDLDASVEEYLHVQAQLSAEEPNSIESGGSVSVSIKQLKSLEATLAGALRREKMAETTIKQLETEIEQLNRLVCQREEDTRCSKMMLKFREDKIHRMEALLDRHLPADSYLQEENKAQSEEIQLLRARADKNPEVTRFASENIRLLDQLRRYQEFYEEGERELLLAEVSEMRNQIVLILDGKSEHVHQYEPDLELKEDTHPQISGSMRDSQDCESLSIELKETSQELEQCRDKLNSCLETNATLTRELNNLHVELTNMKSACNDEHFNVETDNMDLSLLSLDSVHSPPVPSYSLNHAEEILNLQLELDILKTILGEEKSTRVEMEKRALELENELKEAKQSILLHERKEIELNDAKSVIEALESQHILSINELEELKESNNQFLDLVKKQENEIATLKKQIGDIYGEEKLSSACRKLKSQASHTENEGSPLCEKLKKMQASLEKARSFNTRFQSDQASQTSLEQEKVEVRRQVEVETAEVIVCLQEELITLQQQVDDSNKNEILARQSLMTFETEFKSLQEKFSVVTQENEKLGEMLEEKKQNLRLLSENWENLIYEIAEVLSDGNIALENASDQVASISDTFPGSWVTEQVEKIIRSMSEKDLLIEELHKCLEDAQNVKSDMEWKLRSLRGATLAITEAQQQESSDNEREILHLTSQLSQKTSIITELENSIRLGEERLRKAVTCATVAFTVVNHVSEINAAHLQALEFVKSEYIESTETLKQKDALLQEHILLQLDTENRMQTMKAQVEQFQEQTHELLVQLQQSQRTADEQVLEHQHNVKVADIAFSGDDLLEGRQKFDVVKMGVSVMDSCVNDSAGKVSCPTDDFTEGAANGSKHRMGIESNEDTVSAEQHNVESISGASINLREIQKIGPGYGCLSQNILDRERTIVLLRRELESAFDSLREVKAQMVKLLDEKEDVKQSEVQSKKNVEHLTVEVLLFKSEMIDKEQQFESRLLELEEKLQRVEESTVSSNVCWHEMKEGLEVELSNAKAIAAQKTLEASYLLIKIEEMQGTMQDADVTVNALTETNEAIKLEVERHKTIETTLNCEKNHLISELQMLQSSLDVKEKENESMQKKFTENVTEARNLLLELEDTFRLLQGTFTEKFRLIECDLSWLKSQLQLNTQLVSVWLEEIWSEIIGKDCAVSVLHLCHMGILLERVTGLNAENVFLYNGWCDSKSVIADLKNHNSKAKRELEQCSTLKGKLLVDINDSFNRITKKENETVEFKARLNSFEEKIVHLQLQEETMLDRSNSMGTELAILMELDSSRNASMAISAQEKFLREKEELNYQLVIEKIKEEIVLNKIEMELRNVEMEYLLDENETLKNELLKLREENSRANGDLQDEKVRFVSTVEHLSIVNEENLKLQDTACSLQACINRLQAEMDMKCTELALVLKESELKNEDNELHIKTTHALQMENDYLKNELLEFNRKKDDHDAMLMSEFRNCYDLTQSVDMTLDRMFHITDNQMSFLNDRICPEISKYKDMASKIIDELEFVELSVKKLMLQNFSLQSESMRKDDLSKGLSFDLRLLQESASTAKDQSDELEAVLKSIENELVAKTSELDEKNGRIDVLELELAEKENAVQLISSENLELKAHMERMLEMRNTILEELAEKGNVNERLKDELLQMSNLLGQRNHLPEDLQDDMAKLADEKDCLDSQMLILKEQMETAQALAEEHEAIATEFRQIAEEKKLYAADKEEEIKLLEKSIEELECTVSALENKVEFVRGEAEKQRLHREELEMELEAVRHQMLTLPSYGSNIRQNTDGRNHDLTRHLKAKVTELQEAQQNIQVLRKEVADKDSEIAQCKAHISELNMYAEAQAREYKQKRTRSYGAASQSRSNTR